MLMLQLAFAISGFDDNEQYEMFTLLSAILHLGNINMTGDDQATVVNDDGKRMSVGRSNDAT